MSAWVFLPFAFGALSFIGVSIFKKIRENKNAALAQRSQLPPATGIPAIDKAISDGGLAVGEVNSLIGGKMPNVTFDLAGVTALDKMKETARELQAKAMKENRAIFTACQNPCSEIPLDVWQGHQFIQNEVTGIASGQGSVSKFKLQHTPTPGTTTGTVYIKGGDYKPIPPVAVATFVVHQNGNLHFTPIWSPQKCPSWGHCDNDTINLEWPTNPGNNYVVCSYEYEQQTHPDLTCAEPEGPIDQDRWVELKKRLKHKKLSEESTGKDDFFVPENGKNVIRLLPPLNGPFHISRRQHYGQMGGGQTVQCGKREHEKKWTGQCPICDYYNRLWNDSSESRQRGDLSTEQQQLTTKARQIKPVERHYYNVLVNGEVKLFSAGKTVHDQFVRLICGDDQTEAFGDISNPATGRNVTLIKEMRGPYPEYKIIPHRDETPLGTEAEVKSIMEKTYNLDEVAKKWEKSPEEMQIALQKICGNDYVAYHTWKNRNESDPAQDKFMPFYQSVRMTTESLKSMQEFARHIRSVPLEQKLKVGEITEDQYRRLKDAEQRVG